MKNNRLLVLSSAAIPFIYIGLLAGSSSVFAAKPFFDLGVDLSHNDNIGRAELDSDRLSDKILNVSGSANYLHQLDNHSGIVFKAMADWFDHQRYNGLDHMELGVGATYRFKPELSYTAPWYSLGVKAKSLHYPDSEMRDGYSMEVEAMAGKRFTDRIMAKVGIGYRERLARDDSGGLIDDEPIFETETAKAFVGMDYYLDRFVFYGQYTFQTGDVVSTGRATRKIVLASDEIQQDDAIGRDKNNNIRWAYRLDGDTHIADIGVNYSLTRSAALDFAVRAVEVRAVGGNHYDNYSANLGLLYRFK